MKEIKAKSWFALIVMAVLMFVRAFAAPAPDRIPSRVGHDPTSPAGVPSFYNFAYDTLGVNAFRLMTAGTFTQMTTPDTLRIRSSNAADSSWSRLYFVLPDTTLGSRLVRTSGTDTVFIPTAQARYFEQIVCDSASAGTVTVYSKTGGAVAIVVPGATQSYGAFHFFGKGGGGLTAWSAGIDTTTQALTNVGIRFQLRRYNHHIDVVNTPESGFELIDQMTLPDNQSGERNKKVVVSTTDGRGLYFPPASYVGIYVLHTSSTPQVRVRGHVEGYDRLPPIGK